jgi:hypothetical protein
MLAGAGQNLVAIATMSNASVIDTLTVIWSSSSGVIDAKGHFVAGANSGSAIVTASLGTISGSAAVTILTEQPAPTYMLMSAHSADDLVNTVGVNVHVGYFDTPYGAGWNTIVKPAILDLGVRHLRDGGTVVSDDGWMQDVYGKMNDLASHGVHFDLAMQPTNGTANYATMDQLSRLLDFGAPAIESFEGLNEHDLSGRSAWASETRTFQIALYAAAKADARSAGIPVFGPSMGQPGHAGSVGSLSGYLDDGNIHPYPGGKVPLANLTAHETQTTVISGVHPWMVTETGYHNALTSSSDNRPVSEDAAARYIPRLVLQNYLANIGRTYLYEMIDEGSDPAEQEQNFGLLRNNGTPKPAFTALRNLLGLLSDPGPAIEPSPLLAAISGDTVGVSWTIFSKRNGEHYVVFWQEVSSFDLGSLTLLNPPAKTITLALAGTPTVTVFGSLLSASPTQAAHPASSLNLQITDAPLIVRVQ